MGRTPESGSIETAEQTGRLKTAFKRAETWYLSTKERIDPESLALAGLVGFFALYYEPPVIEAATTGLKYLRENVDPEVPRALAAGVTITFNIASLAREHTVLKQKKASISTNALLADTITGNHAAATSFGHLAGVSQSAALALGFSEAINTLPLLGGTSVIHGDRNQAIDFAMATLIVTASSRTAMNTLILRGATEPIVNFLKPKREFIQEKTKKTFGLATKIIPKRNRSSYRE
ncbi:MAG TPA: hypothetical protein VHE53_03275 [Patescibacteria group bacterium]|nr:hypothetical protein [Patescibacteria group bacterium]